MPCPRRRRWSPRLLHARYGSTRGSPERHGSRRVRRALLEAAGIFAVCLAIARRVYVRTGARSVYPVLFLMFVGRSTRTGKTTALETLRLLLRGAGLLDVLLPASFTPQALLADLALRVPQSVRDDGFDQPRWLDRHRHAAQRGIVRDEVAGLLEDCSKDYNAGLLPLLLKLADAPDELDTDLTVGRGLVEVSNVGVSLFGATTPAALREHAAKSHHWLNGLWARVALVAPDEEPPWAFWTDERVLPPDVVQGLRRVYEALPMPKAEYVTDDGEKGPHIIGAMQVGYGTLEARPTREAWAAYAAYDRALFELGRRPGAPERLDATYGRLPGLALRLALAFATVEWAQRQPRTGTPTITTGHWAAAQEIVERWRADAHRILAAALRGEAEEVAAAAVARLVELLRGAGGRAKRGEVLRSLNWSKAQLDAAVAAAGGAVRTVTEASGGRPAEWLELVPEGIASDVTTKGTKAPYQRDEATDFSSNGTTKVPGPPEGNGFSAFSSNGHGGTSEPAAVGRGSEGAALPVIEKWRPTPDGWRQDGTQDMPADTASTIYALDEAGLSIHMNFESGQRYVQRAPVPSSGQDEHMPPAAPPPACPRCGGSLDGPFHDLGYGTAFGAWCDTCSATVWESGNATSQEETE